MIRHYLMFGLIAVAVSVTVFFVACSGGGSGNTVAPATVSVTMSDPPTCSSGNFSAGPIDLISITVAAVKIHASATAGPNDPGWINLTPNLTTPKSVNLVSQGVITTAAGQCFLATLGAPTNLDPGSYQQIRVILASSGSNPACVDTVNKVDAGPNCVWLAAPGSEPQPILLGSEAQTGIKIPSGQIAGGQFTVASGQSKTLNINFDACASLVIQGNGQFRLKPVLHAGEVNTVSSAVDGTLVDSSDPTKVITGPAIVVLESNDGTGTFVNSTFETMPDANGFFSLCPVTGGPYDLVIAAVDSATGVAYAPAVIKGVSAGSSLGKIPLVKSAGAPGTITGQVTATTGSAAAHEAVTLSALQQPAGSSNFYTIPLVKQSLAAVTANVDTGTTACPPNTECATYTLSVPAATPTVVSFTPGTAISFTGTTGNVSPATYKVQAAADNCTASNTTVSVSPGAHSVPDPAPVLSLTGCQ